MSLNGSVASGPGCARATRKPHAEGTRRRVGGGQPAGEIALHACRAPALRLTSGGRLPRARTSDPERCGWHGTSVAAAIKPCAATVGTGKRCSAGVLASAMMPVRLRGAVASAAWPDGAVNDSASIPKPRFATINSSTTRWRRSLRVAGHVDDSEHHAGGCEQHAREDQRRADVASWLVRLPDVAAL